jgi:hypothetical protein
LHAAPGDKIRLLNERKDMHRPAGFCGTTRRKPQRKPRFFGLINDNKVRPHALPPAWSCAASHYEFV